MPKIRLPGKVDILFGRKFPEHLRKRHVPSSDGDFSMGDSYEVYDEEMAAYRKYLEELSEDELDALYEQESVNIEREQREQASQEDKKRFFSKPYADADFEHWSKATYWTMDEAIALLFGKSPEIVTWEKLTSLKQISPFVKRYGRVRDLARRVVNWKQLYDPVSPTIFLAWARRNEFDIHRGLLDAIEKHGHTIADWQDLYKRLKEQYDELKAAYAKLSSRCGGSDEKQQSAKADSSEYITNPYVLKFLDWSIKAVNEYPAWRETQTKVQKTGNLERWLQSTFKCSSREAEILKKVLSEEFEDLK